MKKVAVIVFVLGCFFQSFSQEEKTKSKVFFGIKAGVNALKLSEHEDKTLSFGFQVGTTLTVPISKRFAFQPEVLLQIVNYSEKSNEIFDNGYIINEESIKNTLLLIPLNFKYAISKKVDIDLGPTVGFFVKTDRSQVITQNIDGDVVVFNFDYDDDPYAKKTPLALAANLGVNYNFTDTIYAGLRYSLFIGKFQTLDRTIDNSLFALSVGYSLK